MRSVTGAITPVGGDTKHASNLRLEIVLVQGWHGGSDIVVSWPSHGAC